MKTAWGVPPAYTREISNHQLSAIESVPNFKMFCLTGKKGANDFLNHVEVMDCGNMVWNNPPAIGTPPCAREDSAMAYDPKTCKVLLFGGWSNRWLGDTWLLNVSPIIGPPYACSKVVPDIGPVFGESEITIFGLQFKPGKIEIRFSAGKNEATAEGKFVNENEITCLTPNFEAFGAMDVEVRVSINNEGWTVNKMRFRYFANTSAANCIAFGPGVNSNTKAIYGIEIPFRILAKDTCNANRTSGGDEFVVEVTKEDDPKAPKGSVRQVDFDNGTHEIFYSVPSTGRYRIGRRVRRPRRAARDHPDSWLAVLHGLHRSLDVQAHSRLGASQEEARDALVGRQRQDVPIRRQRQRRERAHHERTNLVVGHRVDGWSADAAEGSRSDRVERQGGCLRWRTFGER